MYVNKKCKCSISRCFRGMLIGVSKMQDKRVINTFIVVLLSALSGWVSAGDHSADDICSLMDRLHLD